MLNGTARRAGKLLRATSATSSACAPPAAVALRVRRASSTARSPPSHYARGGELRGRRPRSTVQATGNPGPPAAAADGDGSINKLIGQRFDPVAQAPAPPSAPSFPPALAGGRRQLLRGPDPHPCRGLGRPSSCCRARVKSSSSQATATDPANLNHRRRAGTPGAGGIDRGSRCSRPLFGRGGGGA